MARQQKRFHEFRHVYNDERPHEALGQKRPGDDLPAITATLPKTLPPIEYAGHLEKRKVGDWHERWKSGQIFPSKTLTGEWVGLEEIDNGIRSVYYGPVLLARFDEREMKFHG